MNIASSLRCRKMAWMREGVWEWYVVFTDAFELLMPIKVISGSSFSTQLINVVALYTKSYKTPWRQYCLSKKGKKAYANQIEIC